MTEFSSTGAPQAIHFRVDGRVQGVSFRYFVLTTAERLGVVGWVRNCPDGSVEGGASGRREQLDRFAQALRRGPALARVDQLVLTDLTVDPGWQRFEIRC
jgi:acylphosphatase